MYRIGRQSKPRRKWPLRIAVIGIIMSVGIGAFWLALQFAKPKTTLQQADAVVTRVAASNDQLLTINNDDFSIELPVGFKQINRLTRPYNLYQFQKTNGAVAQTLEVYVDIIPQNFPVNRVVAVEAQGSQIAIPGEVSENCRDFTKSAGRVTAQGTPAKWEGIDFFCDLNNYQRNVVGISTTSGVNALELSNPAGTKRKIFLNYNDTSLDPRYDTFLQSLRSLRLK